MQPSDARIEELRRLYKEAYNEKISIADARAIAHRLVELYKQLMQPLPREQKPGLPAQNVREES